VRAAVTAPCPVSPVAPPPIPPSAPPPSLHALQAAPVPLVPMRDVAPDWSVVCASIDASPLVRAQPDAAPLSDGDRAALAGACGDVLLRNKDRAASVRGWRLPASLPMCGSFLLFARGAIRSMGMVGVMPCSHHSEMGYAREGGGGSGDLVHLSANELGGKIVLCLSDWVCARV
jgi:hypothetical protein